jgi:ABC-type glycerol-3-phosphate transport system substrate-binding protein
MLNKSLFQTALLIIFGFALVVAVLIFAGILPGFRAAKIGQAGNLVVWGVLPDNSVKDVMNKLKQADSAKFSLTYFDKGADMDQALVEALASGNGPDVIIAPHELILKHRDKVALIPFDSVPLRSYQDTFIDESSLFVATEQKGFWAMPLVVDPLLLYYNKDTYNNANIVKSPTSWEEFVKIQPTLTKVGNNNRLEASAFALGTFGNNNNAKDILSLLILQAGGSPMSNNNGQPLVTLDDGFGFSLKPTEAALNFFLQFADPAKSTYCWNRSLPEARDAFLGEELANYFGFASEAPYLREKNPHLNFNLNLVPQMTSSQTVSVVNRQTFGRLYGVAALKTSTKLTSAWPMIFALTGESYSKDTALAMNMAPARRNLLVPDPAVPDQKIIFDSALITRGWFDLAPIETKSIFQTMNDNAATGRLTPAKAITQAGEEIGKLIGK